MRRAHRGDDTGLTKPPRVRVGVSDQRRAAEASPCAQANLCSDFISDQADDTSVSEKPKVRQRPWVNKPLDCLSGD
jgi:hypothetical protein